MNLPAELYPQYAHVEYKLRESAPLPPIFLLVLDMCCTAEELEVGWGGVPCGGFAGKLVAGQVSSKQNGWR